MILHLEELVVRVLQQNLEGNVALLLRFCAAVWDVDRHSEESESMRIIKLSKIVDWFIHKSARYNITQALSERCVAEVQRCGRRKIGPLRIARQEVIAHLAARQDMQQIVADLSLEHQTIEHV